MTTEEDFHIRLVTWAETGDRLGAVREAVFVHEQHVPLELEYDGLDPECAHALAESAAGEAIGTARLLPSGQIGRMAVLAPWRGRGVGSALLRALLDEADRRGITDIHLHGQTQALGFYARHGFSATGPEFMDAGIPHRRMVRRPGRSTGQ
jgi:predicted GNAT family N-acyltransferase